MPELYQESAARVSPATSNAESGDPAGLKIAYVTMQFPVPSEAFAAVELRALRRADVEVAVFAYKARREGADELLKQHGLSGMHVDHGSAAATLRGCRLALRSPLRPLRLAATVIRSCWARPRELLVALALIPRTLSLCESIAAFKPDLVHLFWGHYPSLLGILLGRTPDAPPVTAFLGAYDLRLASPLSGALAPYAKAILTHVHANRPHILRLGVDPEQVHLSYRGIEVPDPLPKPSKNPFALITIGRLIPLKRMDRCLQVLAAVREVHPEVSLTVLGDGPLRTDLEARARELDVDKHVRFKGHVSHDEVFQHLSESAVFLSMSDTDHLPNTIKEAMIRRCVCVSTETHGIEELITDGVSGFIVPQGDVSAAAARITEVFSKRQEAEAIVKAAQEHVCHTFNVDTVTQERLAIWQAIARTAKPKGLGQNGPQSEQRTRLQEGLQ